MDRLEEIYQAGLRRLELAPDYHYKDSKPKRQKDHKDTHKGTPSAEVSEAAFASRKAKAYVTTTGAFS